MDNHEIRNIIRKVMDNNEYLSVKDAEKLFNVTSSVGLDYLQASADELRKKLCGDQVSYIINQNVNFTNICQCNCLFCGFRRSAGDPEAYTLNLDELYDKLKILVKKGGMEVCFQGGLNPDLDIQGLKTGSFLSQYGNLLSWVKDHFPQLITHSYSPEEIDFLTVMSGKSTSYVLEYLKDHGLDTMPGTAAEILVDEVRQKICPKKINTNRWSEIVKKAHKLGIPTTATIMYGHLETPLHLAEHLNVIRTIQLETRGFTEFIPLPLVATKTALNAMVTPLTRYDRLRMLAVARLFFADLIPNIQASWVKQGFEETGESLHWGVNDVGGTLGDEKITYCAGGEFGNSVEANDLINIICSQGRTPILRDTFYHHLVANKCLAS